MLRRRRPGAAAVADPWGRAGDGGHRGRRGLGHRPLPLTGAAVLLGRADPGERTSDAHTRRGHITKQGSRWLRWMLVEAATTAVRDPQLGRFTAQIAQR